MRTLIFTLTLIVSFISCASIDKMVRSGKYEDAFNYAINKIRRGHTLKAEHISGLEIAFERLNDRDLRAIEDLKSYDKERNLDRILSLYHSLEHRNRLVYDLSPIKSKEGLVANFNLKDYSQMIKATIEDICYYKYNRADELIIVSSKNGSKEDAKKAYSILEEIERLDNNYKDTRRLKDKAYSLGVTTVSLAVDNDLNGNVSHDIARKIKNLPISRQDNKWYDFLPNFDDPHDADMTIVVRLRDLDLGREFERVNNYQESREIVVGIEKVLVHNHRDDRDRNDKDRDGKHNHGKKDHDKSDNDRNDRDRNGASNVYVEKQIVQRVDAFVTEIFREKDAALRGSVQIIDNRRRNTVYDTPVYVNHNFKGYGCRFVGDDRALTDQTKCKLDGNLELYPHDYAMVDVLSDAFADVVMKESKKIVR